MQLRKHSSRSNCLKKRRNCQNNEITVHLAYQSGYSYAYLTFSLKRKAF